MPEQAMPHVDELLGPVTFAAAGLAVAIALQPVAGRPAAEAAADAARPSAGAGTVVVRLPTVEVVGRRTHDVAMTECADPVGRGERAVAAQAGHPHA
jgi:hypothetical protein